MKYPLIFFVSGAPLQSWMAGEAIGPFAFIRKGYETDEGLYQHEFMHVKQAFVLSAVGALLGFAALKFGHYPHSFLWPVLWGAIAGQIVDGLAYKRSRRYRLFAEAQAYAMQTKYPDRAGKNMTVDLGAWRLSQPSYYDLNITQADAKTAIGRFL